MGYQFQGGHSYHYANVKAFIIAEHKACEKIIKLLEKDQKLRLVLIKHPKTSKAMVILLEMQT